ncbi:MAG: phosphoglycerate kinase [Candidatus Caldarchaeales archaeon]
MPGPGRIRFRTIDELDAAGKRIAVRVDLNSSIDPETGRVMLNERFRAHARTVRELLDRGGKLVLLAHQGRRGDPDFTDLSQHAELLSGLVGSRVKFVPDVSGAEAVSAVKGLSSGEAVLLDNVRKLEDEDVEKSPEEHARSSLPRALAPHLDAFVLDAFSVAHRGHASVVGLAALLPTYAGRVMERELSALNDLILATRDVVFVLGGNKPRECTNVLERFIGERPESVRAVLTGGVLGQLFAKSRGYDLGAPSEGFLVKKGHADLLPKVSEIDERIGDRVHVPEDFAYAGRGGSRAEVSLEGLPSPGEILDIGSRTIGRYSGLIEGLEGGTTVVVKGPMGVYERPEFRAGTRAVYSALTKTKASTFIGGGDSVTAIEMLGFRPSDFTFVSLGGGALISYLSGEPMPGLEVLAR